MDLFQSEVSFDLMVCCVGAYVGCQLGLDVGLDWSSEPEIDS